MRSNSYNSNDNAYCNSYQQTYYCYQNGVFQAVKNLQITIIIHK